MRTALVVIDFQNTVFDAPPAFRAEQTLQRIGALIGKARAARAPVIYVQHATPGTSWEAGSAGWHFPAAIAPQPGDFVSPKSASDGFQDTGLHAHLQRHGIASIVVCGYATEFCIDTNLRRAASLQLDTIVASDAHTTRDRPHLAAPAIIEHHNWVWSELGGIRLCASAAIQFA